MHILHRPLRVPRHGPLTPPRGLPTPLRAHVVAMSTKAPQAKKGDYPFSLV